MCNLKNRIQSLHLFHVKSNIDLANSRYQRMMDNHLLKSSLGISTEHNIMYMLVLACQCHYYIVVNLRLVCFVLGKSGLQKWKQCSLTGESPMKWWPIICNTCIHTLRVSTILLFSINSEYSSFRHPCYNNKFDLFNHHVKKKTWHAISSTFNCS